jgi:hypothetical protein
MKLEVSDKDLQTILLGLGELKAKDVFQLIMEIQKQIHTEKEELAKKSV